MNQMESMLSTLQLEQEKKESEKVRKVHQPIETFSGLSGFIVM